MSIWKTDIEFESSKIKRLNSDMSLVASAIYIDGCNDVAKVSLRLKTTHKNGRVYFKTFVVDKEIFINGFDSIRKLYEALT